MRNIRSAITNGSQLLANCDHRSAWMRRLRDLIQGHLADGGGVEQLSMAEQSIIRRASMCELQMEMMETRFAENGGVASADQLNLYQRTASSTRRLLESVGLGRRAKNVTPPHPLDYARQIDHEADEAEEITA
jgi:hypothetical protein